MSKNYNKIQPQPQQPHFIAITAKAKSGTHSHAGALERGGIGAWERGNGDKRQ